MPTQFNYDNSELQTISDQTRKDIVAHIHDLIEDLSIKKYQDEPRSHLGISLIGAECARQTWYSFRWVKHKLFTGRMLRLFQDGHREEAHFINMLRDIGIKISEVDPTTGKQWLISKLGGHYGGSCDSKGNIPFLPQGLPILLEFKTHNGKSFAGLIDKGLKIDKPQHYAQMCGYGKEMGLKYGLYCGKNKNDSDYHFELVDLDWNYATELERKANDIISAERPPNKIAENPAFYKCKICDYRGVCHEGVAVDINCRSCQHAKPIEDAEWHCGLYNGTIPKDFIKTGCPQHVSVNRY